MISGLQVLAGRRLLVVDADASRADAITRMLVEVGAAAESATALHQALDLLEAAVPAFDGAILGERLADGDGAVLARAIRTSPPLFELRLVIIAGGSPPEGVDAACAWPVSTEDLVAAITAPTRRDAPSIAEAPVLDLVELESIAGGLTVELVGMLRRFAGQATHLATEAMAAAAAADTGVAQSRAHALKGAAFSAGAMRLGRAAQAFEQAAAATDWNTATAIDLVGEAGALAGAIEALPEPAA